MKPKFKKGDWVYIMGHTGCYQLIENMVGNKEMYPLTTAGQSYMSDGRFSDHQTSPVLVHATRDNQTLLESLTGEKYSDAPPSGEELTRELLKVGKKVICWVWDDDIADRVLALIVRVDITKDVFLEEIGTKWDHALPLDPSELKILDRSIILSDTQTSLTMPLT